ncbi:MAG TPA: DUF6094 domain-containing protein [Isosphaeraceae bacterium]|jgi:hypothetical protein|nr:DUF6094 domain-containing protein [Isosphaeraceae bacterium]
MRLAAQAKLGFYPAHPDAVRAICHHLSPPEGGGDEVHVLDPCAGEGEAIRILAEHLGVAAERTFGIELDGGRATKVRENLPGARVLGPASFAGTRITGRSFALVYCNPPFDDELGGGRREEFAFAERATTLLRASGVLVLVMPITAISRNDAFQEFLDAFYDDATLFAWPAAVRRFREVCYIGRRRRQEAPAGADGYLRSLGLRRDPSLPTLGEGDTTWAVPRSEGPNRFEKTALTDEELVEALGRSPLNRRLAEPPPLVLKRPPADLSSGHVATILASGFLDGVVRPPGESPHVVRGTARKQKYQSLPPTATTDDDTGVTTVKEVWSEMILLTVRAVNATGVIRTFENRPADAPNNGVVAGEGTP